ncbi:hypothetical protein K737_300049 [Holospora undulata HU1]|uniref:Uncharacterized protein n=1 Tax=Holospora undulata HU1 TaxID=1321371 RepID=A0A061JIK0_9PROT|nr:hypothetical protein [Holospora undulata]ETZ05502.1 hypothetical protein K737_300049 [Holospora undulata HU1]
MRGRASQSYILSDCRQASRRVEGIDAQNILEDKERNTNQIVDEEMKNNIIWILYLNQYKKVTIMFFLHVWLRVIFSQ